MRVECKEVTIIFRPLHIQLRTSCEAIKKLGGFFFSPTCHVQKKKRLSPGFPQKKNVFSGRGCQIQSISYTVAKKNQTAVYMIWPVAKVNGFKSNNQIWF